MAYNSVRNLGFSAADSTEMDPDIVFGMCASWSNWQAVTFYHRCSLNINVYDGFSMLSTAFDSSMFLSFFLSGTCHLDSQVGYTSRLAVVDFCGFQLGFLVIGLLSDIHMIIIYFYAAVMNSFAFHQWFYFPCVVLCSIVIFAG